MSRATTTSPVFDASQNRSRLPRLSGITGPRSYLADGNGADVPTQRHRLRNILNTVSRSFDKPKKVETSTPGSNASNDILRLSIAASVRRSPTLDDSYNWMQIRKFNELLMCEGSDEDDEPAATDEMPKQRGRAGAAHAAPSPVAALTLPPIASFDEGHPSPSRPSRPVSPLALLGQDCSGARE